ncbi:putative transcription elongation factor s-ii [Phaeomoniella chlamydospora]|uniref:Transcription elongation factor n=1 Tax=Phaeomoniella chlamydospora TaxID=158046 RepID=A0A0G2EMY2_PHACM|nr:putative transcription elongation factor s-ii [Phaeomoniella chlamydospora]
MKELEKGVKPTEELLRQTAVGKMVNKLKAHKSPEVAKLASTIVNKWRRDINSLKGPSGAATPTGGKGMNGTASPRPSATPTPQPKLENTVPPDKRTHKTDKVDINKTSDDSRNNCIRLLYDGLAHTSSVSATKVLSIAVAIEEAALRICGDGQSSAAPYREKVRSLFMNLKNKSNPGLRHRILGGEVTPERFVSMTHDELKSEQQKAEEIKIAKENLDKAMVAQEEKSVSTSLQCGKCKEKRVSYSQAQTRSADEPMTTFCECLSCGNRWKFS